MNFPNVGQVEQIAMTEIYAPYEWNTRGKFIAADCVELAEDMAKHGLNIPITVVPFHDVTKPQFKYKVIAGFRRHTAARINKWDSITCSVRMGLTPIQEVSWNIRENVQRKDLNIVQSAHALKLFQEEGWLARDIANELGQSVGWVEVRLNLLKLPDDVQLLAAAGIINQDQIKKLSRAASKDEMYKMVRRIKDARESGDKVDIAPKYKNPKKLSAPGTEVITQLLDLIFEHLGERGIGFHTRCLAWAAGNITTEAFWEHFKNFIEDTSPMPINFNITADEFLNQTVNYG